MEFAVLGESLRSLGPGVFGNYLRISELEVHCGLFTSFEEAFTDVKKDDPLLLSVEAGRSPSSLPWTR
ncbi:MAG: hypothetical protein IKQ60_07545 [Candidatus Methanomethylophilaceae archaeon]|nr:hypothetical protein [Candidatus Methanomethylophilaceae archaeon]